jgi:hypothetical protein
MVKLPLWSFASNNQGVHHDRVGNTHSEAASVPASLLQVVWGGLLHNPSPSGALRQSVLELWGAALMHDQLAVHMTRSHCIHVMQWRKGCGWLGCTIMIMLLATVNMIQVWHHQIWCALLAFSLRKQFGGAKVRIIGG